MKEKKNIDRLFQEGFKDFEAQPSKQVWDNIKNELGNDRKPVVSLWIKYAAAAVVLLLFTTVGGLLLFNNPEPTSTVVDTEKETPKTETKNEESHESNTVFDSETKANTSAITEVEIDTSTTTPSKATMNAVENTVVSNENNAEESGLSPQTKRERKQNERVKVSGKNAQKTDKALNEDALFSNQNNAEVAVTASEENKTETSIRKDVQPNVSDEEKVEEGIASTTEKKETTPTDSLSIEEAIAQTKDALDELEEDALAKRWQVAANVAPVYYNTLGKGSHIGQQFANNEKTGNINTSYGVNVAYAITDKLSVRSGLNALNVSYSTNDVMLYENAGGNSTALRNINLNNSSEDISAISTSSLVPQAEGVLNTKYSTSINQEISYFEVPLEFQYNLVDKKFGLEVITGISTFLLNGNEVYSRLENESKYLGEANNINNVSFSTNLGLGLGYRFTKRLKMHIDPMFKYQLNGYKNTAGDFKPYLLGVYSGFSFKF